LGDVSIASAIEQRQRSDGEMLRAKLRSRTLGALIAVVALLLVLATLFVTLATSGANAAEIARFQPLSPPQISAAAVYVTDITSDTELFALNADTPLPPASLTKVASALVILDEANLEDRIEIIQEDLVPAEESQVGLVVGDKMTVRDLLFGMLIPSGNDATLALARYIGAKHLGGSATPAEAVSEFVRLMNEKAKELGANGAHFVLPTGVDADGHVMTARDVAILTEVALQNPLFTEIVGTPNAVLASEKLPDGYSITTTNQLLLEGIVRGVKTGTTPKAGGCLVTSYQVGSNDVVAVVLGSQLTEDADGLQDNSARFADTRALMSATSTDYVWIDPAEPGTIDGLLEELTIWDADVADDALLPVPSASADEIRFRLILDPPVAPADPVGEIQFFVGDQLLSERLAIQAG
jgi:D-alanyl-D-alanine carboxypeptidase (penicillin-binding protein 5/6)